MTRSIAAAAISGLAVVAAACGGAEQAREAERPARPGAATSRVTVSPDQSLALERVAEKLTARCMRRHGWKYVVADVPEAALAPDTPYGLDDVEFRKRHGFAAVKLPDGRAATPQGEQDQDPALADFIAYQAAFTEEEQAAYQQDHMGAARRYEVPIPQGGSITAPLGGCFAEGTKAVYGADLKRWWNAQIVVNQFGVMAQRQAWRDPKLLAAVEKWRDCMRKRGWDVPKGKRTPPVNVAETPDAALADRYGVDDATCGREFRVQEIGETIEQRERLRVERRYEAQLIVYNEIVKSAQARVASAPAEG